MPPDGRFRLFRPEDLISDEDLASNEADARQVGRPADDLDSANLWLSQDDNLLVRGVKPHSAEKSRLVSRSLQAVATAMHGKWFARRHGLHYLELYSGPGRLLDERSGQEQPGSPIEALSISKPFHRYIFSDVSTDCADALRQRVGHRTDVTVLCGDANDPVHLEKVAAALNERALVIAYLDTARPRDLRWSTVEFLADRFYFIDFIINLPVNNVQRAIYGARAGGLEAPGAAGAFLDHPRPWELLRRTTAATFEAIRDYYDQRLMRLGFLKPARRTVEFPARSPYYDLLLVSRHPAAVDIWNRTNPTPQDPQLRISGDPSFES